MIFPPFIRKKREKPRQKINQPLERPYRFIALTQGQIAIVDAEDFEWLSEQNWQATWAKDSSTFYAGTRLPGRGHTSSVGMHRVILNLSHGEYCDHINHNGLDNRKENLRKCTPSAARKLHGCFAKLNFP